MVGIAMVRIAMVRIALESSLKPYAPRLLRPYASPGSSERLERSIHMCIYIALALEDVRVGEVSTEAGVERVQRGGQLPYCVVIGPIEWHGLFEGLEGPAWLGLGSGSGSVVSGQG